MNTDFDKMLQELIYGYRTKCTEDAKILGDAIEAGEAVSMYSTLFENCNQPSLSTNEKLLHSTRLFYFMGYCMNYNNGIPMLEVLSDWIDNDEKRKVINAVKSQTNLFEVLIEQGADIKTLADYIDEREIIEYAINEEKKSTGVLKRILERKKGNKNEGVHSKSITLNTIKESDKKPVTNQKQKDGFNSKEWCAILYFTDYGERKETDYDTDLVKSFHSKHKLPFGETTFIQNFKDVKRHIEKSEKPAIRLINKILPYFSNNRTVLEYAKNQLSIITDDLERE